MAALAFLVFVVAQRFQRQTKSAWHKYPPSSFNQNQPKTPWQDTMVIESRVA